MEKMKYENLIGNERYHLAATSWARGYCPKYECDDETVFELPCWIEVYDDRNHAYGRKGYRVHISDWRRSTRYHRVEYWLEDNGTATVR